MDSTTETRAPSAGHPAAGTADATGTADAAVIRVAIVDDQHLVRSGFAMLINSQPDLRVVSEAATGDAAVRALAATPADVVMMDVRMPGMDGIEATRRILADHTPPAGGRATGAAAGPRIVVLTTFDLDEYALAAIHAGASGFLLKDAPPEELLEAIRTVHRGDAVIAPSTTRRLLDHVAPLLRQPTPEQHAHAEAVARLTVREREVFGLIAQGLSNPEIAAKLYLSEATVKTHVGHILAKLEARDRVQAVVMAYETGIVRP
ncbi:DNA-binding response regulator [Arthrobacter pityocampae]|uniref:DNA-binding response regulator n=2 Tax=Arthrobacter pityocampae TaxID=547334 RepID=A0A2S5J1C0_9MICC|nr:response regulator transcription factor [Arthrobacter pityocampae]PPB50604.1 DNA-binding response regulator [Arthrobacter pityocampae]